MKASKHSDQEGHDGDWRNLAELSLPSRRGNERLAMEWLVKAVRGLKLSTGRLERLRTAVSEATMNAMEHGNQYRPEALVAIQVRSSSAELSVRITDEGGSKVLDPEWEAPDLEAKLEGVQRPRGWGLFLIKNMVDEMYTTSDGACHTVELIVRLEEGDKDAG